MIELTSYYLGMFSWAVYIEPFILGSALLGFFNWASYLTVALIVLVTMWIYLLLRTRKDQLTMTVVVFTGCGLAIATLLTLPYLNAAYLDAMGVRATAVVERSSQVTQYSFNSRRVDSRSNTRIDLLVTAPDGLQFETYVYQRTGIMGPTFMEGRRLEAGDRIFVAYVEGLPANIAAIAEGPDTAWRIEARSIETSRQMFPFNENNYMTSLHDQRLAAFIAAYEDIADPEIIERFKAYRNEIEALDLPDFTIIDQFLSPSDDAFSTQEWP